MNGRINFTGSRGIKCDNMKCLIVPGVWYDLSKISFEMGAEATYGEEQRPFPDFV